MSYFAPMKKISKPGNDEHALYYEKYIDKVDEKISVLLKPL